MIRRLLICVPLLAILSACQSEQVKTPHLNFVLDTTDHDFAFETTTGVLCKTWDWEHTPKQPIDSIPLCMMLGH